MNRRSLALKLTWIAVACAAFGGLTVFSSGGRAGIDPLSEQTLAISGERESESDVSIMTGAVSSAVLIVRAVIELDAAQSDITLADLVSSRNLSASAMEEMKRTRLADAPKPGETRTFTEMGLYDAFRPVLAKVELKTGENLRLRLPSRVTISKRKLEVRAKDVELELMRAFKELCSGCEFEISNLGVPIVAESALKNQSRWHLKTRSELPRGGFSIPLEITDANGSTRNYWVSGQLTVRRKVPVSSRTIAIGERLRAEDVTMQMKDVTFSSDQPATDFDLASSVAARSLAAGQIVWRSSLRKEAVVKNGDAVKVVAGGDSWTISLDGIAQSSGSIGETVRIKIPRTQKLISGLVTEKGTVEVR